MLRLLCLFWLVAPACTDSTGVAGGGPGDADPPALVLREVAAGLVQPVFLTAPPGDARLFVVEQPGRIRVVENGALRGEPYLDLTSRVSRGGERGLLGLAFHPDHAANGFLYVNYTDARGDTRVERYRATADRARADPGSARLVLAVEQPFSNHNGGMVAFGPDGMLYVGMGDGGSGGDPHGHGQNPGTLLGALLRVDVSRGDPYAVPADNPFVGRAGARPEVWAVGLRNPWRFSFDRRTGELYVGDVGQNAWEEISVAPAGRAGLNNGWNRMEGTHCYGGAACDRAGLLLPVLEYDHSGGACSVTGGYVYRGTAIPGLRGWYLYADYCTGRVRAFRLSGERAVDDRALGLTDVGPVSSFGEDAAGELYVVAHGGRVYRVEARP